MGNDANLATAALSQAKLLHVADAGLQTQINTLSTATSGVGGSPLQSQINVEVATHANAITDPYTKIDEEKKLEIGARDSAITSAVFFCFRISSYWRDLQMNNSYLKFSDFC